MRQVVMHAKIAVALAIGALVLAGCSSTKTVIIRETVSLAPAAASAPVATTPGYTDTQACQAFHDAITIGIPPGAAPAGTDTMTWLQGQIGQADPQLRTAHNAFINAWQAVPPDLAQINRQTRIIKRLCQKAGA
jgi:hypothetical protein